METITKIYAAFDTLSGRILDMVQADSDSHAVRELLLSMKVPLRDTDVYCLGTVNSQYPNDIPKVSFSSLTFSWFDKPVQVPWSAYSFPESLAEAISPLGAAAKIADVQRREHREDFIKE